MNNLGNVSQFPELTQIYQAVVNHQSDWTFNGKKQNTQIFKNKNLYYIDHNGVRYVEQNKNSNSAYAQRVRTGAKIIWVIRLSDNCYLGRIENNVVYHKTKKQRVFVKDDRKE